MSEPGNPGIARYENVDADYLKKRQLRPSAGWVLLWALGVGAVISGFFYGWNTGLAAGGFWGMTLAPALIMVGIGGYLKTLFPSVPLYLWWLLAYVLFVAINIRGVEITLRVGLVIT